MKQECLLSLVGVGLLWVGPLAVPCAAQSQEPPKVQAPQAGVPQIATLEGRYVRIAWNNEGFVTLGYKLANLSVGEPWMLLEVGMTLRDGVPEYLMTPAAISLSTPDAKTVPLPSIAGFRKRISGRCRTGRGFSVTRSTTSANQDGDNCGDSGGEDLHGCRQAGTPAPLLASLSWGAGTVYQSAA